MQRNIMKHGIWATVAILAFSFASCDKANYIPVEKDAAASIDYSKPYTEVLSVQKNYYSVGESGRVYTTYEHMFSKIHAKVMLTKYSERKSSMFSLSESDEEYVMTVQRWKTKEVFSKTKEEISTDDPEELTRWIIEETKEDYDVYICFDPEADRWDGHTVKK